MNPSEIQKANTSLKTTQGMIKEGAAN